MVRTVKLSYTTVPQAIEIIARWRKAQSVVIRTAYNRVREGKKDKDILDLLRTMPQGRMDSWLTLSALKRSKALHRANPNTTVIFGGKHNLQLRSQGKITAEEWKAKRLLPVYFEGHAKSHGEQGGNHRFVLDIEHNTVWAGLPCPNVNNSLAALPPCLLWSTEIQKGYCWDGLYNTNTRTVTSPSFDDRFPSRSVFKPWAFVMTWSGS